MTNHCFTAKNCLLFLQYGCLLCRPEPAGCPAALRPVPHPHQPAGAALWFPDHPFLWFTARIREPVQSALANPVIPSFLWAAASSLHHTECRRSSSSTWVNEAGAGVPCCHQWTSPKARWYHSCSPEQRQQFCEKLKPSEQHRLKSVMLRSTWKNYEFQRKLNQYSLGF